MAVDEKYYRREIAEPQLGPTVIVEDGTIVANANSYIAVAYADTYHAATVYNQAWTAATPDTKAQAVINATRIIDANMTFNGWIVSNAQILKWPRQLCPNYEVATFPYGYPYGMASGYNYYPMDSIPKCLKDATAQEALEIIRVGSDPTNIALPPFGIQSTTVGEISVTFKSGSDAIDASGVSPMSNEVERLLAPLGQSMSSGGSVRIERVM